MCSGKQSACSAYRSERASSAEPSAAGTALAVIGGIAASWHACSISARHSLYSHTCSHTPVQQKCSHLHLNTLGPEESLCLLEYGRMCYVDPRLCGDCVRRAGAIEVRGALQQRCDAGSGGRTMAAGETPETTLRSTRTAPPSPRLSPFASDTENASRGSPAERRTATAADAGAPAGCGWCCEASSARARAALAKNTGSRCCAACATQRCSSCSSRKMCVAALPCTCAAMLPPVPLQNSECMALWR